MPASPSAPAQVRRRTPTHRHAPLAAAGDPVLPCASSNSPADALNHYAHASEMLHDEVALLAR
ncbi:MAG: hypothetical protein M0Q13_10000 [Methanothrix sp.]|nr:hypothetical protein [Methanothrix sp.]